ncbi:hypothetical protein [Streptomyces sp. NPDC058308]|uniref:hypothetical protein n=1 Tax=Streptomyces sp. NPDC058308 TaxID=3346440 RepID=UPI0036E3FB03
MNAPNGERTGEAGWLIPLVLLVPVVLVRHLTGLTTPWLIGAWAVWALAALLTVAEWVTVARRGARDRRGWTTCLLVHVALVWQAAALA